MNYPTAAEMTQRGWRQHGIPVDRFALSYEILPNGCWEWTKGRTTVGYGHFSVGRVYYQAHRIAYILHVGPIPTGLTLDHLCHSNDPACLGGDRCAHRRCVNPAHLEPVTALENMRRGRGTSLTPDKIAAIRRLLASGASQRSLAPTFGVDHSTISRAIRGERWADLQDAPAVAA